MRNGLGPSLQREWRRLAASHRVILRSAGSPRPPEDSSAAIVSRVPDIEVDWPASDLCNHRRTLQIESNGSWARYRLRVRDPEGLPETGAYLVRCARPCRGRPVPVCLVHLDTPTIRLLVSSTRASFVAGGPGVEPAALLARFLLGEPIAAILRRDGEPVVGPEARAQVAKLLALGKRVGGEAGPNELAILDRMDPESLQIPSFLRRRLATYRDRLRQRQRPVEACRPTDAEVDEEVSRLSRLVASRTFSVLRLDAAGIQGVVNPGPTAIQSPRPAVAFRLSLAPPPLGPGLGLVFWPIGDPRGRASRPACLGDAAEVLRWFHGAGDLYGVMDTVVNYIETNGVGASFEEPEASGPAPIPRTRLLEEMRRRVAAVRPSI